jgi:PAS domain S-box-containing protein
MSQKTSPLARERSAEISSLIETLHRTQKRLEELTAGEVDSVVDQEGHAFFLQRAQEELRLSESIRQGAILDALPAQIALLDAQGVILSVNEAWRRFASINVLQMPDFGLGENYVETCERATGDCSEEARAIGTGIRGVLEGNTKDFAMEYPCHSPTEQHWFRLVVTPLLEDSPTGAVVMHIDITERKMTEEAFRSSEESSRHTSQQLAKILDSSLDAICTFDAQGNFLQVSAACEKIWGYRQDELIGTPYIDKVLPADHDSTHQAGVEIRAGHPTRAFENRYVRKDGTIAHILWSAWWSETDQNMFCVARDNTEAKRADAALEESQSRYRSLFENMLEGYAYCRIFYEQSQPVDLVYLEVNGAFETLTGLKDVIGKKVSVVIPGILESSPELFELYVRVATTGKTEQCEVYVKPLQKWLAISVYSQEKDYFIAVFEDVTERKRAEIEIRFNEQRYRVLLDATTAIVWDTPASGEFVVEQPNWTAFTGQSFEELRGWGWLNAIHPDDRAGTERIWSEAVNSKTPYEVEHRLRARDQSYRNMMVRAVPILAEDKTIRQWIGIHTDVTERRRAEERIAEQAELLDKTNDAIMVRDLDGTILLWNKGAERMYGWTQEEAVGRKAYEFLHAEPERFKETNALSVRQGEWTGELQHLTSTGEEITVEARWTLICDHNGNPKSLLAINTNITEKKRIEHQFLRAQRMESIGTLAGGVAHDLNNILAPILMSIQILKLSATDPETVGILKTIETSAKRGADIVRQVLSFARGMESQRIEVQAKHLLGEVENIVRETFPKNIQTEFSVPRDIWTIEGDPTQIHQILLNLSVNARDAMPNGGTLSVSAENCILDEHYSGMNLHAKAGNYVMINVTDSGSGMSKRVIDKIFEPFFTTKELSKGTGLGLSTVMAIVKGHEGLINVYSEPGKGTTFKVYLPAMGISSSATVEDDSSILPRGTGQTVLVIDDESSILTITSQTLQAFGYKVLTAVDGAEGVAMFAQNTQGIAVVVTDMNMPIMNGLATVRALIRINPLVKIVAASGLNVDGDAGKLAEMGVTHSIVKPYTADTLLRTLQQVLETPSAAGTDVITTSAKS